MTQSSSGPADPTATDTGLSPAPVRPTMEPSRAALAAVAADPGAFRARLSALVTDHGLDPDRLPRSAAADRRERADAVAADRRERRLVERVRLLDDLPVGLTLTGPAYRDTPIVYVNRWFRELTGYSLDALRGRNPRVFRAPQTAASDRADFREALSTWSRATVTVRNRRRDGVPFVSRVSLCPLFGDAGTVTHWVAAQEPVEWPDGDPRD